MKVSFQSFFLYKKQQVNRKKNIKYEKILFIANTSQDIDTAFFILMKASLLNITATIFLVTSVTILLVTFVITVFINCKSVRFNCTFYVLFLVSFLSPKLRYTPISF